MKKSNEQYRSILLNDYKNTNLTSDGKLLAVFLYNTHEEMHLTRMHLEMLMVDTTHGINKGKKVIVYGCGKRWEQYCFQFL